MSARAIIRTEGLTKDYRMGDSVVHALRQVTVTVDEGEFVAIMGPSGSGKSTFMNVVGCLDRPTSGAYWLNGQDVAPLGDVELASLRNRYLGFVFQTFHLLSRSTALENVELPLLYTTTPAAERRADGHHAGDVVSRADLDGTFTSATPAA